MAASCIYFYAMSNILFRLAPLKNKFTFLVVATVMILIHSGVLGFVSNRLFGRNLLNLFTVGVADQYILGPMFQPSIFGVFLILSLSLFLSKRTILAVIALSVAASFHANYFLPAGVMTVCYMIQRKAEGLSFLQTLGIGLLALVLVLPALVYDCRAFAPTSPEHWNKAVHILQYIRTPHHSRPAVWFNIGVVIKIVLVVGALYVIRKSRIYNLILSLFLVGLILTLVQYILEVHTLSQLSPWRISVIIIPISALILITRGTVWSVETIRERWNVPKKMHSVVLVSFIFVLVACGIAMMVVDFRKSASSDEVGMMRFVECSRKESDIYLVPLAMERFRIAAGVPIVADWKSPPYSDHEVIDWYERCTIIQFFYRSAEGDRRNLLPNLCSRFGVTHIVVESKDQAVPSDMLMRVYEDKFYRIYETKKFGP
jgi:hypothetical protein